MQNHKYSDVEEQWLLDNHSRYDTPQLLADSFNEKFNTHLSRDAIRQHCVKKSRTSVLCTTSYVF